MSDDTYLDALKMLARRELSEARLRQRLLRRQHDPDAIEQAIAIQPRYFVGVKNLAVLYHRAGFQSKSTEMWERALALAPEDKTREAIRSHLQRLL